jgi:hypothetical protein
MRYSLCSYSLHRTVAAGKMDVFGYGAAKTLPGIAHLLRYNIVIILN